MSIFLSIAEVVAEDPLISLEVAALLATVFYLLRISGQPISGRPLSNFLDAADDGLSSNSLGDGFCGLFEVGGLLSLPKKSLRGQRL